MAANSVDVMLDTQSMVKNSAKIGKYKDLLLGQLKTESEEMASDPSSYGTHACLYEQVSDMFDNAVSELLTESAAVGSLLPIKALDFPVLIKQQLQLATKDIMQTEVTKSPIVKKHIEQTYVKDPKSGKRWKYPQCFFNGEFKEIYDAGLGMKINPTKVALPIFEYSIVENLTEGNEFDQFTYDLKIERAFVGDTEILIDPAMRINLSDNTWLGGRINKTVKDTNGNDLVVDDLISGIVDWEKGTVTLTSATGQITDIVFSGRLSNTRNNRTVQFEYEREEREWKIADGFKVDAPYTLEELQDHKALMDIDLYKKTYNNIAELLTQEEDSQVLAWLDEEFEKYKGLELDPLQWNSFVKTKPFDFDSTGITTALPCEYIEKMFKFAIEGLMIDLAVTAKMEDLTFVIYGNPRYIRFLDSTVKWVVRPGSTSNGVKLNYGYGIMTTANFKVQVVSTMKCNVQYDSEAQQHYGLRIIPFPLSKEQFTFKHYKYTTNILTSNDSAYHANVNQGYPAGSMTYVVGTSRYTNASVQGIQAQVPIINAEQYITL